MAQVAKRARFELPHERLDGGDDDDIVILSKTTSKIELLPPSPPPPPQTLLEFEAELRQLPENDDEDIDKLLYETRSPSPTPPPPPWHTTPLQHSQHHYDGAHNACSFTHLFLCHYLLKSNGRDVHTIDRWIKFACVEYTREQPWQKLGRREDQYVSPREALRFACCGDTIQLVEEISGVLHYDPSLDVHSVEHEFVRESVLMPLWKVIRWMFLLAMQAPTTAGFVSSQKFIHVLSMRWREPGPLEAKERRRLQARVFPRGSVDAYRGHAEDSLDLERIETLLAPHTIDDLFFVEFLDTHLNEPDAMGLPTSDPHRGTSVYIRFATLRDLEQYMHARYPKCVDSHAAPNVLTARRNCFDLVLWRDTGRHMPDECLDRYFCTTLTEEEEAAMA